MKNLLLRTITGLFGSAFLLIAFTGSALAQDELRTLWDKTTLTESLPDWFTVGSVRGIAYGTIDGSHRIYVADRENMTFQVLDATDGSEVELETAFDLTGLSGGTFAFNDVEISEDGVIFAGNLSSSAENPFRLYWWTTEGGSYTDSLTIHAPYRLGDKFTVRGSLEDNTIEVWLAAPADPGVIYVATTEDQGDSWDIEEITLTGDNVLIGSNPAVTPLALGRSSGFYVGGNSSAPARYEADGTFVTGSTLNSASRNGMTAFQLEGEDYLSIYSYRPDGSTTANSTGQVIVYNVNDPSNPTIVAESPLMGEDVSTYSSIHGEANVSINEDGTYNVYAFDGVNGFAAFTNAPAPVSEDPENLFFSEYIEGSSNNKALEILNASDIEVNLANYQIAQSTNGGGWQYFNSFADGATIAAGNVYVLITDEVDSNLFAAEDADEVLTWPHPLGFNGDDARALIHINPATNDTTWLDIFGDPDNDPGTAWAVAGESSGTQDHTLLRKASVTIGNSTALASFGTNTDDSEWIVLDQNDFSNLGSLTEDYVVPEPEPEPEPYFDNPSNLFFSEYIEGSGNNKALEIFNNTDSTITLTNYQIAQSSNGGGWQYFQSFADSATIGSGEVYVLITDQVDAELFAAEDADEVLSFPSAIHFNGNDARALIHIDAESGDTTWLDVFGDPDSEDNWAVAGVDAGTVDHTLIRKESIYNGNITPLSSFGTNEEDSEWIVADQDDFSDLGAEKQLVSNERNHSNLPNSFVLSQNYPNPFNPTSDISFTLPQAHNVKLEVYNITGQLVATLVNDRMSAGTHTVQFNAQNLSSGIYIYRITAGGFVESKKMTLIK